VPITRRNAIYLGAAALALGGVGVGFFRNGATLGNGANAEPAAAAATNFSTAELMQAGPLGDRSMGADNAPITIIEYASMTCPHCARFDTEVFPQLKEKYIDTGKVRYILREFPLDRLAAAAFMLARCADKDKYFPLIDTLFKQQATWVVPTDATKQLLLIAKEAGFTDSSFKACLANQKVLDGIEWVRARAVEKFKVNSTPTFFINGEMHRGEMSLDEIEKAIQPYLKA
jgi:protein-disulfide isomerase